MTTIKKKCWVEITPNGNIVRVYMTDVSAIFSSDWDNKTFNGTISYKVPTPKKK